MNTIYFPAGTEHVQFGGLAQLMAAASNPLSDDATDVELIAHGGARIRWEEELLAAAKSGALPVKDSFTFGPCSYAVGYALQWSLVSIVDLRVFLADRPFAIEVVPSRRPLNPARQIGDGLDLSLTERYEIQARDNIAAGRCSLHEAAKILNIETKDSHKSILNKWEAAAKSGVLPVFARGQQDRYVYEEYARMSVFETEVFCDDLNEWIEANDPRMKYRFPVPLAVAPGISPVAAEGVDFDMVATRKQLIDAFGRFTGMDMAWFDNLKDSPKLKAARKCTGQAGRRGAEPLFCPYEVMQWLSDPKRKKGRKINESTAWRLLKGSFGKVYDLHSIGDPDAN